MNKTTAELIGICLAVQPQSVTTSHWAIWPAGAKQQRPCPFAGAPKLAEGQLPLRTVLDALRPALTNPKIGKVAHNAKYDYTILDRYDLRVTPITFDTMIAEWLTDPATKHKG
ncbi:MAG: hypothetical protein R3D55_03525 [Chloroflexota bacterium]